MSTITNKLLPIFHREGIGVSMILILLFLFLSVSSPYFLTAENLSNLLLQSVFILIVAFGTMFVLTMGGIDLSVGSILGLCGGVSGWLMVHGTNMWLAILAGLALGTLIGLFNGIIITRLRISPFLATFAMLYIARGLLFLLTSKEPIRNFASQEFKFIAQGYVLGIPSPVWIALIIFLLCYFLFSFTKFGRFVVAVGSNKEAAHLSGISTNNINIRVYALSGLLAAASGIMLTSRLTSVQPLMGTNYELDAISAAVIGGTSMFGGKGSVVGVAVGSTILALISNGLDLLSVNQFYRLIITGLIILIAVGAERMTSSRAD
ncbi:MULTISPECIES: ABC transporter permease [Paenibacillus]|uniref:Ribose ABC transporter permease n=2 Tax=Paenibacillus validus TaxID=44253 RepID=A0A7X3CRK9_9BACL|nr:MULTISPECIES: ABC transporter permease [Paenibacillus]MED4606163.1 ABC transporter permease [Paenibacillus validus]MUG69821.1 ribose ABC transporter permease [Paenibacillus validus]